MSKDISIVTSELPAHIKLGSALGNENVTSEHLSVPRVKQLQKMSNEVDENHSDYMDNVKVGDFINTVTGENYGQEILLVNVHFKEEYICWKKREAGGGLLGSYPSKAEAITALTEAKEKENEVDITQTQTHTLLKVDEKTGNIADIPFLFDCANSKLRVSKEWNTQILKMSGDRFAALWKMSSVSTTNRKGQAFMNIDISNVGWLNEETYKAAKDFYMKSYGG